MEGNSRYTWRWQSSVLSNALRGLHWVHLDIHFDVVIVRTWRPSWSKFADTIGGCNQVILEIQCQAVIEASLEAMIDRNSMITWRWSMGGAQGADGTSVNNSSRPPLQVHVRVVNTPKHSMRVQFDGQIPNCRHWAGYQRVVQRLRLYIHIMLLLLLFDTCIWSKSLN